MLLSTVDSDKPVMSFTKNPSKTKRRREHGYRARKASKGGKNVLKRRNEKKRKHLSVSSRRFKSNKVAKNKFYKKRR